MTASGPRYDRYGSNRECMVRIGPDRPCILFVPPLLEEMNRTRAFMATVMRRLAEAGYGSILPDLPGTGESVRALEEIRWPEWREALQELAPLAVTTVAIRGGCLLDDACDLPHWRLAPVDGASLVRDLERSGMVSGGGSAGYDVPSELLSELRMATPSSAGSIRTVRLTSDRIEADAKVNGPPLWRRSEPQNSSELSAAATLDIVEWMRQCVAC